MLSHSLSSVPRHFSTHSPFFELQIWRRNFDARRRHRQSNARARYRAESAKSERWCVPTSNATPRPLSPPPRTSVRQGIDGLSTSVPHGREHLVTLQPQLLTNETKPIIVGKNRGASGKSLHLCPPCVPHVISLIIDIVLPSYGFAARVVPIVEYHVCHALRVIHSSESNAPALT